MSSFTLVVILGVLSILAGISLMATPLITFMSAGYFIIIMFFIWGIAGIIQGVSDKRYDKKFFFSILSLILGIIGFAVPGAAAMNNSIILYLAAGWFVIHGVLSIVDVLTTKKKDVSTGMKILGVVLGVLEVILGIYSFMHPTVLALNLGVLIGLYFVVSGVNTIATGISTCEGGNILTVLFTVMGILTIIGGISMLATPLLTFLGIGHCIIMLFFINGILGMVRGFIEKSYDKHFWLAILSLILGIVGFVVPGVADMNNSIVLFLAAAWFILHGVLVIVDAVKSKNEIGTGMMILGIVLGVLELIMGIYSIAHPAVLAISIGFLVGFYFIESGISMILAGSTCSNTVATVKRLFY